MAIRTCCLDPLHTVRGPHVCCGRGGVWVPRELVRETHPATIIEGERPATWVGGGSLSRYVLELPTGPTCPLAMDACMPEKACPWPSPMHHAHVWMSRYAAKDPRPHIRPNGSSECQRTKRRQIQSQSDGVLSGRRREYMSQALEELGFHFPAAVEWLCFVCFHYVTLPVRLRTVPLQSMMATFFLPLLSKVFIFIFIIS
ncbi:hypothetical protein GW17_00010827 [Ensete ventricosum]|nr:hypothetical protein GW17_00010827 [Ensete ventricosum]